MKNRLILTSHQSPGDIVMLTAAVRELHTAYPGRFQTDVRTSADAIFENNPYLTPLDQHDPEVTSLDMHYPAIHQSNQRPYHFIHGYTQYLEQQLDLRIPVTQFRGDIYLSEAEKQMPPPGADLGVPKRFWIVIAGGKYDFTAKWWNPESYQRVIDHFQDRITFVQCGEEGHWHPPLKNVVNLVGQTTLREFIRLMYHADGVLCPVTLAMHLAVAVESKQTKRHGRPCVVVAGGREPAHWEAYPNQQFISTNGSLSCCAQGGCWKSRCQLVSDGDPKDTRDVCESPVQVSEKLRIPKCMDMISPEEVIRRIDLYYHGGLLRYQSNGAQQKDTAMTATTTLKERDHTTNGNGAATKKNKVLIKFRHGLGDAVQFGIVLRHLRARRPDWEIDVATLRGKHSALQGFCHRVYHEHEQQPDEGAYDRCYDLGWHEQNRASGRFPSTKSARCLREEFGIDPDPKLFSYEVSVSEHVRQRAAEYLQSVCGDRAPQDGRYPVLLLHYEGNTSGEKKNLTQQTAKKICESAIEAGLVPVILDWDRRSSLPDQQRIFCPPTGPGDIWGGFGSGDAAVLGALIEQATLMIGVDSGPLHAAGATTTPTIGVWTRHFPAQYFDLCDNVTHFVPENWQELGFGRNAETANYFEQHYDFRTYHDLDNELSAEIVARGAQQQSGSLLRCGDFWIRRDNIQQDLVIVRDIYEEDAYRTRLLSSNAGPQVVVDVGAHIGCFATLWHKKNPAARIICVEACPENLEALRANVGEFAEVVHAACTYETEPIALLNAVRPNCESTGGSVVVPRADLKTSDLRQEGYEYWHDLRELPKVTLEELMQQFGFDHIDVLKLDCEGSEYSILGQTPSRQRIRLAVGEYHGRRRWDTFREAELADWDYGHILEAGENGGLFHLANPVWPPEQQVLQAGHGDEKPSRLPPTVAEPDATQSRRTLMCPPLLRVAVPAGIGDSVWALMKVPDMLRQYGAEQAHIALCGPPPQRAKPFIERFDFVASVEYSSWECVEQPPYTRQGVYNWAPSGVGWHNEFDWMLQANRHLESGLRLETWLPEFAIDWNIADRITFTGREVRLARELAEQLGPYCVFYLGPELGNTTAGHNRGPLWTPQEWGRLAERCRALGLAIVVVGAEYDRSYFESHVAQHLGSCFDAIGKWPIGHTFAVVQRSRFVVAYQSGIGIFGVYMGVPAAVFWRPDGDSIDPAGYVSFREAMASAWAPQPALDSGRYLPSIYTRCSPESIVEHARSHNWHHGD